MDQQDEQVPAAMHADVLLPPPVPVCGCQFWQNVGVDNFHCFGRLSSQSNGTCTSTAPRVCRSCLLLSGLSFWPSTELPPLPHPPFELRRSPLLPACFGAPASHQAGCTR